mmetsp:Transcript_17100/g.39158  ORF Transcript_17100/g.39158 Transcript_17100/m.39158 type:complete len:263 (+) Transcript_17100:2075-2863(+)
MMRWPALTADGTRMCTACPSDVLAKSVSPCAASSGTTTSSVSSGRTMLSSTFWPPRAPCGMAQRTMAGTSSHASHTISAALSMTAARRGVPCTCCNEPPPRGVRKDGAPIGLPVELEPRSQGEMHAPSTRARLIDLPREPPALRAPAVSGARTSARSTECVAPAVGCAHAAAAGLVSGIGLSSLTSVAAADGDTAPAPAVAALGSFVNSASRHMPPMRTCTASPTAHAACSPAAGKRPRTWRRGTERRTPSSRAHANSRSTV